MRTYILIILSTFFIKCASQGSPSGGPIDKSGPIVTSIDPIESLIDSNQPLTITFNEYIDQSSVASSITINGEKEFNIKVRYNKIIIYPFEKWGSVNELYLSRNILDYQDNLMDTPVLKIFRTNNSEIFEGKISGVLLNTIDDNIYEVGLYSIDNEKVEFIKKVEADIEREFSFVNIPNGDYRIGVIEGKIVDFDYDYRSHRYGINSKAIRISNENKLSNVKIVIDEPLPKLNIISGYLINSNHPVLTLSNGNEESFFIKPNNNIKKYINGDVINLDFNYANRLETYQLGEYEFIANYGTDTLPPSIDNIILNQDKLDIYFSEPIKLLSNKVFIDSNQNHINHSIVNPFTLTAKLKINDTSSIYLNSNVIADYENNQIDSTLNIDIPNFNINKKFGSLKGEINYTGSMNIVIKIINIETQDEYFISTNKDRFIFKNIPPGEYKLQSYEQKNNNKEVYYSGVWEPFEQAAQFIEYPDLIDIRAHWEVEGIVINY